MSNLFPQKPAIVIEAETPEMEQWAYEVNSALDAANAEGSSYLSRMKEAGELLTKAKKQCKAGSWIAWLNKHSINRMTAYRAIKAFSKCNTLLHLSDALPDLAEEKEETEIASAPDPNLVYCSRNCRVGIGPSNCKECKKKRAKESAPASPAQAPSNGSPPPEPVSGIQKILDQAILHQKLAKRVISLSKEIRAIERGEVYRRATGDRTEPLAEFLLSASKKLVSTAPVKICEACHGNFEPNPDSEPCGDCGGKGVLTAAEVQALAERLNF